MSSLYITCICAGLEHFQSRWFNNNNNTEFLGWVDGWSKQLPGHSYSSWVRLSWAGLCQYKKNASSTAVGCFWIDLLVLEPACTLLYSPGSLLSSCLQSNLHNRLNLCRQTSLPPMEMCLQSLSKRDGLNFWGKFSKEWTEITFNRHSFQ